MKKLLKFIIYALLVSSVVFSLAPISRKKVSSFSNDVARKPLALFSRIGASIKSPFSIIIHVRDLKAQNKQLTGTLQAMEVDKSRILELEHENKLLQQELGLLDKATQNTLIAARIIRQEPTAFLDYIIIDKGKDDGVSESEPVISGGVLVGLVKSSAAHSSTVVLITSKDSLIQAMLQESRSKGVLRGGISGLHLDNMMSDVEYKEGENVVTSGLGETLKQGILIGRAGKTRSSGSGVFKSISVDPIVDLSNLELVFVQKQ
ncbi:MAG: rod shape-determining protein MreC [Patescibacteria group bacterium]